MGSVHATQVVRPPDGLVGAPGAQHVGLAATARLGGEVSWWWWSHPCHGWHLVRPLPNGANPNQARSGIRAAPVGALCQLHSGDGMNHHQVLGASATAASA
jgi:hypothetical protein